jgi:hypothetical protein
LNSGNAIFVRFAETSSPKEPASAEGKNVLVAFAAWIAWPGTMNWNSLIDPLCLPQFSDATRIPDFALSEKYRDGRQHLDQILCSCFIRHDILKYVESGVEIKAIFRDPILL